MQAVVSTPECYKRANIWTNLAVPACQPLGDESVWGTLFELRDNTDIIIVATKVSIACVEVVLLSNKVVLPSKIMVPLIFFSVSILYLKKTIQTKPSCVKQCYCLIIVCTY